MAMRWKMTNDEIIQLLEDIARKSNNAIDKLIEIRQNCLDSRKQKLSYVTKKLEIIVGACNRSLDKLQ